MDISTKGNPDTKLPTNEPEAILNEKSAKLQLLIEEQLMTTESESNKDVPNLPVRR